MFKEDKKSTDIWSENCRDQRSSIYGRSWSLLEVIVGKKHNTMKRKNG